LPPAAIIIVLIAQIFGGSGYVIEEKFLGDYDDLDPIFMTGMQGLWGFIIYLILLPIMQIIPCSDKILCPNNQIENSLLAF